MAADGFHKVGGTFDKSVKLSLFVLIDGGHFLFLRAEREDLFYSVSVSELFIVIAHSVGDLKQGTFGFVTVLLNPQRLTSFLSEFGVSVRVVANSKAEKF